MNSNCLKLNFPVGSCETSHTPQKAAATIRVRDLESQLLEEPAATPRSFWSRLFSCCFPRRDRKHCLHPISNEWTEHDNALDRDISPYRLEILRPVQIPTADNGIDSSNTTNDDDKIAGYISMSSTQSAGMMTVSEINSAIAIEACSIVIYGSVSAVTEPVGPSGLSTVKKTGGNSPPQLVPIPPAEVHSTTSSSNVESARGVDDSYIYKPQPFDSFDSYADHIRSGRTKPVHDVETPGFVAILGRSGDGSLQLVRSTQTDPTRPSIDVDSRASLAAWDRYASKPLTEHQQRSARRALPTSTRPSVDVDSLAALAARMAMLSSLQWSTHYAHSAPPYQPAFDCLNAFLTVRQITHFVNSVRTGQNIKAPEIRHVARRSQPALDFRATLKLILPLCQSETWIFTTKESHTVW